MFHCIYGGVRVIISKCICTFKPVLSGHSKRRPKLFFKTDYLLMQVKIIAEHSAIFSTFNKLPFVFKTFVFSIFEWPLKTGFTVFFFL